MEENLSLFQLQDCQSIQKAFERGAAYCLTEESVFAMMTPILSTIRTQTTGLENQINAIESMGTSEGIDITNFNNMDNATENDDDILSRLKSNWFPGGDAVGGLFDSKCIPCGFRIPTKAQLRAEIEKAAKAFIEHWKQWLKQFLKQLMAFQDLFDLPKKYIDFCALLNYLKDFVCVPDLQRILAILMALLTRISFDIGAIFDLLLGLIAPLLIPFLSGLVDMLTQYILMIVRPIECIIDSLQDMLAKLDPQALYQNIEKNIENLDKTISIGRKQGDVVGTTGENLAKLPVVPNDLQVELHAGPDRWLEYEFNMLGPLADSIKRNKRDKQVAVEKADAELQALARNPPKDVTAAEMERYRQQVQKAKDNYQDKVDDRDLTEIQQLNNKIDSAVTGAKSIIFRLVKYLKDAVAIVEGFFHAIYDELKKLMGEFLGGSGSLTASLLSKMEIIQLVSLITSFIKFLMKGLECDDKGTGSDKIKVEQFINLNSDYAIFTDDEGNIHIEEGDSAITDAIESTVQALNTGLDKSGNKLPTNLLNQSKLQNAVSSKLQNAVSSKSKSTELLLKEKGVYLDQSRQKLKSLIQYTGDPVLNTEITEALEAITTPVKVTYKCPLQLKVSQIEQINLWMKQIDTL